MPDSIQRAVEVLQQGGVIAYPTEYCFGLGCDPANSGAIERILKIKGRHKQQGLILLAADIAQVEQQAELHSSPMVDEIMLSWPGPVTWLLTPRAHVSDWVCGQHQTVAIRVSAHATAHALCAEFGSVIVSTSANRHGEEALRTTAAVREVMGNEVDYVVDGPVGNSLQPSQIRDGKNGEVIR